MDEIKNIKDTIRALEQENLITSDWFNRRISNLERAIMFLTLAVSLSFILVFIGYIAKWL